MRRSLNTRFLAPLAAYLVLAATTGWALHEAHEVTVHNCQQIEHVKEALRDTIEEASSLAGTSKIRTPAERRNSEEFYRYALSHLAAKTCS